MKSLKTYIKEQFIPFPKRALFIMKHLKQYVIEASKARQLSTLYPFITESSKPEPVDVMCGRFQPLTKAHLQMMVDAHKENGRKVVVLAQHSKKLDSKHPFPDEVMEKQFALVHKKYPFIEFYFTYNQSPANFDIIKGKQDGWMKIMKEHNYDPHSWLCGTDRYEMYKKMVDNYAELNGAYNLKPVETARTAEDISATKAREAIKNDNKEEFLKNCPEEVLPLWDTYKEYVK